MSDKCLAEEDMLATEGHIRLYEPKSKTRKDYVFTEIFEVIHVTNILGKLSLMPDFGSKTIPFKHRRLRKAKFQFGSADSSENAGDGSKLWYINLFALVWSRSKLSLFRYVYIGILQTNALISVD
jgi:hypothetical protein